MVKVTAYENHRVEVTPEQIGAPAIITERKWHDRMVRRCEVIVGQINRHVDHFERGGVGVCFDLVGMCSYCGATWTEDSDTYNGGCCDSDETNAPEED